MTNIAPGSDGNEGVQHVEMESLNAHCLDHQAANMTPPWTHCDLPDGMLQTVRAPDKSPRIGA